MAAATRIPSNTFAVGLAGLGEVRPAACATFGVPDALAQASWGVAAVAWPHPTTAVAS
jgi:hypothetical protein